VTAALTLEARLKRLMLFRVVMVTTLLLIAVSVEAVSETLLQVNPLYFVIVATYALTVVNAALLRYVSALRAQIYGQVVGDLLVITSLVYIRGGSRGGFMLLYPLSVLSGSVMLSRRGALLLALVAGACYGGILWAVRLGLVPPQGLLDVSYMPRSALHYSVFVTTVACGTVALIGSYFSESLRQVGERLEEAHVQVADLRELNQLIVSSIHSGLIIADPLGRILYINEFGAQILGLVPEGVRGRGLKAVPAPPLFEPTAVEARAATASLTRLELAYDRPNGTPLQLGLSVTPLAAGARTGRGYLLVFQDLTDIKRLEQEVRTKEKLAAVGEMTAQLAHEIRNPLGSISGSAQVLLTEAGISLDQQRLLAIITRESKRLSETLNRFLFQARSHAVAREPVDVGPLVEQAVTLLRHGPEVRSVHEIVLDIGEGPHVCLADSDQITQVFWNLVRNGLEAMPDGGTLKVEVRNDGDDLILSVHDQGRGMGHEEQRRMFEPFQSQSPTGTGLGLAIVYRIVREHGGDIAVRSERQRGTEVQVRLPRVGVPSASPVAMATLSTSASKVG
jgi:two-component system sensor histidine kinase PilS (NtrC family)